MGRKYSTRKSRKRTKSTKRTYKKYIRKVNKRHKTRKYKYKGGEPIYPSLCGDKHWEIVKDGTGNGVEIGQGMRGIIYKCTRKGDPTKTYAMKVVKKMY